jgi:hypothetical protein
MLTPLITAANPHIVKMIMSIYKGLSFINSTELFPAIAHQIKTVPIIKVIQKYICSIFPFLSGGELANASPPLPLLLLPLPLLFTGA